MTAPMDFLQNSIPFFGVAAYCVTKIVNFIKLPQKENYPKNENDPKLHHRFDNQNYQDSYHSKNCHHLQNKNLSMRPLSY